MRRVRWKSYTWRCDRGTVVFELPEGWYSVSEDSIISFSSASQQSALTIAVYADPPLTFEAIERHILERRPFGDSRGRSERAGIPNQAGYVEEFRSRRDDREVDWVVHFLFFGFATVIASVNSTLNEMATDRPTFDEILNSIRLVAPTK